MKNKLRFLLLCATISFSALAQLPSITITSVINAPITVGTVLKVDYRYTAAADSYIYCGINLQDDWTPVSFVVGQGLDVAKAGTNVTGSFNITIPANTKPTATLTGQQNYKINIELKSLNTVTWLAGDYPPTRLNFTASNVITPAVSVTSIPTFVIAGTNLVVNYKYTAASATGKLTALISKNGGLNPWDYISTVAYDEVNPVGVGTDVAGTFTLAIPSDTAPTTSLTGNQNYRVTLELRDVNNTFLAGDYVNKDYSITASLGRNEFGFANTLSVYPNPTTDILKIANFQNLSSLSFSIINITGQTIQKSNISKEGSINVSALNKGVYLLSVEAKDGLKQFKFIKD